MPTLSRQLRTFELVVNVSGAMDVPFDDWPSSIKEPILEALEKVSEREQMPLSIVHAKYDSDPDLEEGQIGKHYLHVIASEVVMADARTLDPARLIGELPAEIREKLN